MPKFLVVHPIAGTASAVVEAPSEDAAEEAFMRLWENDEPAVDVTWEFHEHIVEGNVCHVDVSDLEISEVGDA